MKTPKNLKQLNLRRGAALLLIAALMLSLMKPELLRAESTETEPVLTESLALASSEADPAGAGELMISSSAIGERSSGSKSGMDGSIPVVTGGSLYVVKGQTFTPDANSGTWTSDTTKIVTVSKKGVATAKAAGTAVLRAANTKAEIKVFVLAPALKEKSVTRLPGETWTPEITNAADSWKYDDHRQEYGVCWFSSNPEIAEVDKKSGEVTAISKGTATITAYINGKTASGKIKVVDTAAPKTDPGEGGIILSPLQGALLRFTGSFSLKNVAWESLDETDPLEPEQNKNGKIICYENRVVRVTPAGKITAVGVGEASLRITAENGEKRTLRVKVPEPSAKVVYLNKNASKNIKLYGVKAKDADFAVSGAAIVTASAGKITAGEETGHTTVLCKYGIGKKSSFTFPIEVYVENPSITNLTPKNAAGTAYNLEMIPGESKELVFSALCHPVAFKSSKPAIAFVDEDNTVHALSPGKTKLTAKINGKTSSIDVTVKPFTSQAEITGCSMKDANTLTISAKTAAALANQELYLVAANRVTEAAEYVINTTPQKPEANGTITTSISLSTDPLTGMVGSIPAKRLDSSGAPFGEETAVFPYLLSLSFAIKEGETYKTLAAPSYVENPEKIAPRSIPAITTSKKGIQVPGEYVGTDKSLLGCKQAFLNLSISHFLFAVCDKNNPEEVNQAMQFHGIGYPMTFYNGKYYVFNPVTVTKYTGYIKTLNANGIDVTGQILLDREITAVNMRYHTLRGDKSHSYYSWEYEEQDGRERVEAVFQYLAQIFSQEDVCISKWILGNEVNSYKAWQYSGNMTETQFFDSYVQTFHTLYHAVKSNNSAAKVYICSDQLWTGSNPHGYTSTAFMSKFDSRMRKRDTSVDWNLAFHPYGFPMWDNNNHGGSSTLKTMGNIGDVTGYLKTSMKHPDGTYPSVLCSELGYSYISRSGIAQPESQKNALLEAYRIAKANPDIDGIQVRAIFDDPNEVKQGLYFGLLGRPAGIAYEAAD